MRKTKAPIIPKRFEKEKIINEMGSKGNKLDNPFLNVQCSDSDKLKAETYIKTIETFQQTRFDLLYQENQKILME